MNTHSVLRTNIGLWFAMLSPLMAPIFGVLVAWLLGQLPD